MHKALRLVIYSVAPLILLSTMLRTVVAGQVGSDSYPTGDAYIVVNSSNGPVTVHFKRPGASERWMTEEIDPLGKILVGCSHSIARINTFDDSNLINSYNYRFRCSDGLFYKVALEQNSRLWEIVSVDFTEYYNSIWDDG